MAINSYLCIRKIKRFKDLRQATMKKILFVSLFLGGMLMFTACHDRETYADQKKRERTAISQFLVDSTINVITETEFKANGGVTDVSKNEYVLFQSTGVYMQIIRQGCGAAIKDGETTTVLCRFKEVNILTDSVQLTNNYYFYAMIPDKMSVKNTSGTYTASFISGLMYSSYGATVPTGGLVPMPYIKVGRPSKEGEEIAKVKLIVPHSQGHTSAATSVYPCYYEITYERGL